MLWQIQSQLTKKTPSARRQQIIKNILAHRGLTTKKQIELFLYPPLPQRITPPEVGIKKSALAKTVNRLRQAIKDKEKIIIYGDYDADGITATAILWETLYQLGADVIPFIPQRDLHGYGLSIKGIKDIFSLKPQLIITVDNGIVAHEAAQFVADQGLDLIITDHHLPSSRLPPAFALVHTTELSGAGVAWFLSKTLLPRQANRCLDLVTLGTVADLMPLTGANRSIVKTGLAALPNTKRIGLKALFKEAGLNRQPLSTYHLSYIIAPRLNAMGRLEHGLDSLRLLCTKDIRRARQLARILGSTNRQRQDLTQNLFAQAKSLITNPSRKIHIIDHQDFHEGVIGLVAGKLTETFYRPTIVISRQTEVSKASARSVNGINIIELIRQFDSLLINAGGHPMAAGFTIKTAKIELFRRRLEKHAHQVIPEESLKPQLTLDCQLELNDINWPLYHLLEKLEPFGVANPQPKFALSKIIPLNLNYVGQNRQHLRLHLPSFIAKQAHLTAIGFNLKDKFPPSFFHQPLNLAFTIDIDTWNNTQSLQLKIKDLQPSAASDIS